LEELRRLPEREYKEKAIRLVMMSLLKEGAEPLCGLNRVVRKEQ